MQVVFEPKPTSQPRKFFFRGLLLELALILLWVVLPDGWLSAAVRNYAIVAHYPVMLMLEVFGQTLPTAILGLLAGLALMAAIWGFLIYLTVRLGKGTLARLHLSRRQKMMLGCGLGLVGIMGLVLLAISGGQATPLPFTPAPEVRTVVSANTAFALDLYHQLESQPGNLFFSPYSISTALAMTCAGARGRTEGEMAGVLHLDLPQEKLHPAFNALVERMDQIQRWNRITLATANSLWCQQDYRFTDAFLNLVRANYAAETRTADFRRAPGSAAGEMNRWVGQKTRGKIQAMADPARFDALTRLVLCNAIYFKGKWLHQFKTKDTKPAPFHVATNQTVTVPMMWQKAHFKTTASEDGTVELLEMLYSGKDLSMIVLLPNTRYYLPGEAPPDLSRLEQNLTTNSLAAWLAKLDRASPRETSVSLPRFTTTQSFDLAGDLTSLGMATAFNGSANFSGMDGTTNLYLSDVLHRAFVEVNEAGTEAAAATWVHVAVKGMADRFIVDHPFIFLIRENGSGSILFLGRIIDPTR